MVYFRFSDVAHGGEAINLWAENKSATMFIIYSLIKSIFKHKLQGFTGSDLLLFSDLCLRKFNICGF